MNEIQGQFNLADLKKKKKKEKKEKRKKRNEAWPKNNLY